MAHRDFTNSLTQGKKEGRSSLSWFPKEHNEVPTEREYLVAVGFCPPKSRKKKFYVAVVHWQQRNYQNCDCRAELLLIDYLMFAAHMILSLSDSVAVASTSKKKFLQEGT